MKQLVDSRDETSSRQTVLTQSAPRVMTRCWPLSQSIPPKQNVPEPTLVIGYWRCRLPNGRLSLLRNPHKGLTHSPLSPVWPAADRWWFFVHRTGWWDVGVRRGGGGDGGGGRGVENYKWLITAARSAKTRCGGFFLFFFCFLFFVFVLFCFVCV